MAAATRAAGAAIKVAAPEAAAARTAAGKVAGKAADPRKTAPGSKAAQQRQQIENIKANGQRRRQNAEAWARMQEEAAAGGGSSSEPQQQAASPSPTSPGGGLPSIAVPAAASTGSGFLLGVMVWAGVLAYFRGGGPEVKKLIRAKFFNQTGG